MNHHVKRATATCVIALAVLLITRTHFSAYAAPAGPITSENKLFTVDASPTEELGQILVAVHRLDGEKKSLYWSKKAPWSNSSMVGGLYIRKSISNDGNYAIIQPAFGNDWALIRKDASPVFYDKWKIHNAAGTNVMDRTDSVLWHGSTAPMEFFLEAQQVYAVWFSVADKWVTINLSSGELSAPNAELTNLLTAEATRRSLAAARAHQPNLIKSMLRPARSWIGEWIPAASPPPQASIFAQPELYSGYLFLAHRKVPDAEPYLRKLLEYPFLMRYTHTAYLSPPVFTVRSHERELADRAFRIFNDLPVDPPRSRHMGFDFRTEIDKPSHYLAGITGSVQLPIVVPSTNAGNVWIYAIPAHYKPGKWSPDDKGVVPLLCGFESPPGLPSNLEIEFDYIQYGLHSLTPGEYRVKAIWDRRAPFAKRDEFGIAEPGDYESAESAAIKVAAGAVVNLPTLDCTNRVGGASSYYAADAVRKKLKPAPKPSRFPHFSAAFVEKPITPLSGWKVTTNQNNGTFDLSLARVVEVAGDTSLRAQMLELNFVVSPNNTNSISTNTITLDVRDEHTCKFAASTSFDVATRTLTARVPVFPRRGRISIQLQNQSGTLCSYTIQNGGASQRHTWVARKLPIKRSLAQGEVTLTAITRKTGATLELGSNLTNWANSEIIYQDSEGNRSHRIRDFCQHEPSVKVLAWFEQNSDPLTSQLREFIAPVPD